MKQIHFVSTPVPNYLTFILCSLGINWKNEYSETYTNFLSKLDHTYLSEHQSYLLFGDGASSSLTELFYFLPAHVGFEKDNRIIEYFQVLSRAATCHDFKQLFLRFQNDIKEIQQFYPTFLKDYEDDISKELCDVIHSLAGIYLQNYDKYLSQVWFPMFEELEETKATIELLFRGKDVIGDWERLTGFKFHAESYQLALIPFIKNGPGANSLSYDKNLFVADTDASTLNYYKFFISHEVGTHLLKEYTLDQFSSDKQEDWATAYIAMENIARIYNMKILPNSLAYTLGELYYHDSIFDKLYEELEKEFPGDITKQYLNAIKRFQSTQK